MNASKIYFSSAARCIEATQKSLRKMLQNPALCFPRRQQEDGWADFSLMQVAILAVSRRLIEFGLSVRDASQIATYSIGERLIKIVCIDENHTPQVKDILQEYANIYAYIYLDNGRRKLSLYQDEVLPSVNQSFEAALVLPIGSIVARAFKLLGVRGTDQMTDLRDDVVLYARENNIWDAQDLYGGPVAHFFDWKKIYTGKDIDQAEVSRKLARQIAQASIVNLGNNDSKTSPTKISRTSVKAVKPSRKMARQKAKKRSEPVTKYTARPAKATSFKQRKAAKKTVRR